MGRTVEVKEGNLLNPIIMKGLTLNKNLTAYALHGTPLSMDFLGPCHSLETLYAGVDLVFLSTFEF